MNMIKRILNILHDLWLDFLWFFSGDENYLPENKEEAVF